jgi:deoxycytidine triphosphate deaminase
MSTAITIEKIMSVGLVFLKIKIKSNGYKKPAIMELRETYLVANNETVNMPNAIAVANG